MYGLESSFRGTAAVTRAQTMTQQAFQWSSSGSSFLSWMGSFMPIFRGNNIRTRTIYGLPFRSGYYGFATGDEVLPRYHLDMDLASPRSGRQHVCVKQYP